MRQAFRQPGFTRLYAGLTTSMFGDSVMLLVLSMWVKTVTGSNALAGLTFFFMVIPVLFAPLLGPWIDRVERQPLLVWGHLASGVGVLPLVLVRGEGQVWIIWAVAMLYGLSFVVLPAALNGLLAVPRFAEYPHAGLAPQQHTDALAHERLVVCHKHAQLSHRQS